MVKIQVLKKDSPVHIITLPKDVIEATGWKQGDSISAVVLNKNEVILKKEN